MTTEARSIILAMLAAAILTPLLGHLLSRNFPPTLEDGEGMDANKHRRRDVVIEYLSVGFIMAGFSVPFLLERSSSLTPTATNIVLMFACMGLGFVGSIWAMTALLGDRHATSFLSYFERKRGISRAGARFLARVIVVVATLAVIIVTGIRLFAAE